MRFRIRVALMAGAFAPVLGAQGTVPGWYRETRTTSRAVGERAAAAGPATEARVRAWEAGGSSRTEGGPSAFDAASDAYLLTRAADKTAYQVVPSRRLLRTMEPAVMTANTKATVATLGIEHLGFKDLGDGGVILGHRTRKIETRYTSTAPSLVAGKGGTERHETTMTMWIASDGTDPMVAAWLASRPKPVAGAERSRPRGMVLRSEARTEGMPPATRISTTEVVVWRRENVDTSLFSIPAGYQRVAASDELRAKRQQNAALQAAYSELKRLSASPAPADRVRAKQLGDSLFRIIIADQAKRKHPAQAKP